MTALKGLLSASFVVFSVVGPAAAQAPPTTPPPRPTRIQASVGVPVGFASGEFGNNVDSAAGISVSLDVGLGGSIVSVGGELSHLWYGRDSRKVDLGPAIPELAGLGDGDHRQCHDAGARSRARAAAPREVAAVR